MYYVGIDWASNKHDICLLADDGRILSEFTISHDWQGFKKLGHAVAGLGEVRFNIERSEGLLVDWLLDQGYQVYVTPANVLARRRHRRSKDDRQDAYFLAHLLRLGDPDCRPLIRQSAVVIHLQQLIKAYEDIGQELRRDSNRLNNLLREYYPSVLQAFSVYTTATFLDFVRDYPTPEAAQAITVDSLRLFLEAHRYPHIEKYLPRIYQSIQTPIPKTFAQYAFVEAMQLLVPRIRFLVDQQKMLRQRIKVVFDSHPDASWWRCLPGNTGILTPARLLAAIGDDRRRFPSAATLQAVGGTCPVTRQSNKQTSVEFRWACSKPLRQALQGFAMATVKKGVGSGWARAYFFEQLARGHSKPRAYRALANNWVRIIWKLWQTGEIYDEAIHLTNRARRGKSLAA